MLKEVVEDNCSNNVVVNSDLRAVMLFGEIDYQAASQIIPALLELDSSKGDIEFLISSDGGDEAAGWAIYDALLLTRSNVIGQCFGECMSMAALLLQGCDTRLLAPNCRFMIHNGTITLGSVQQEKLSRIQTEASTMTQRYKEELAKRSGLTLKEVTKFCDGEFYMSAQEAVNHGFADGVLLPKTVSKRQKDTK